MLSIRKLIAHVCSLSLTHKAPSSICSRRQFQILPIFQKNYKKGKIFHENCLLADNSHEISYLILRKLGKISQNLSSAAVVIGALRVKRGFAALKPDLIFSPVGL